VDLKPEELKEIKMAFPGKTGGERGERINVARLYE
jgi:hypothetical protein